MSCCRQGWRSGTTRRLSGRAAEVSCESQRPWMVPVVLSILYLRRHGMGRPGFVVIPATTHTAGIPAVLCCCVQSELLRTPFTEAAPLPQRNGASGANAAGTPQRVKRCEPPRQAEICSTRTGQERNSIPDPAQLHMQPHAPVHVPHSGSVACLQHRLDSSDRSLHIYAALHRPLSAGPVRLPHYTVHALMHVQRPLTTAS